MITKVNLTNFRNFKERIFSFSPDITVIVGANASGKSNILESIFLLSGGKSFRAKIEEEMINYSTDIARVKGKITDLRSQTSILEVVLTRGEVKIGDSDIQKSPRKKLIVNGIARRLVDFAGNLKTVLFGPWDLDLVSQSPSIRRNFLDTIFSQVDREYRRAIMSYEKGVRQRNKLLFRIREEGVSRSQLLFWDKLLIKNGNYISQKREEFIEFANSRVGLNSQEFSLIYDKSSITESRLEQYKEEEIAAATTLVGPHRDDIIFKIINTKSNTKDGERELARYGSRGEQRMGVLWVKLAELSFVEEKTQVKPVLLLDDIFSELDHEHRDIVMAIAKNQQTIITSADPHNIDRKLTIEVIDLK